MPVPKRKHSRARRDKKHANKFITPKTFSSCNECNTPAMPHQACLTCGFYKGKKILTTKLDRSLGRAERQSARAQRQQSAADQVPASE